jgi:hypothetical protein
MKYQQLDLGGDMTVELYVEKWNGRVFIGYRKGISQMFADAKALRRFLQLPVKTPSRERLDAWLEGLDPVVDHETPVGDPQDPAATGFGPEQHGA